VKLYPECDDVSSSKYRDRGPGQISGRNDPDGPCNGGLDNGQLELP